MSSQPRPQSFRSHRAIPPASYLLAGLVLGAEVLRRGWLAATGPDLASLWSVLVAAALVVVWIASRMRAMIVQDRLIRLEMRLRLGRLLGEERRAQVESMGLREMIAMRFASDAELPALFERVAGRKLVGQNDIKRTVESWQADWLRI